MNGAIGEWAVGFHGTSSSGMTGFTGISQSRFIGIGGANAFAGKKAENRNDLIPVGIYFAQNIDSCYKMNIALGGSNYQVCFQCRIHPDHIWLCSNKQYMVCDSPIYVRPYGICLKKI
eukprot:TRINITY_DN15448_c0_g1_i1.p1 TRINITY_DN15448_c0_g1~~TRINITY_DN15448_c0_g1_i1.p1  ORF type:complete len:118 (-),score=13.50 TRINITY_DN15448_c0_g1_i1:48-401(-)